MECLAQHSTLIPDVAEVVSRLRDRGLKIGSTTGYTRPMLEILLRHAADQGYTLDCALCPEDVGAGRPFPWMIYENAVRMRVYPLSRSQRESNVLPWKSAHVIRNWRSSYENLRRRLAQYTDCRPLAFLSDCGDQGFVSEAIKIQERGQTGEPNHDCEYRESTFPSIRNRDPRNAVTSQNPAKISNSVDHARSGGAALLPTKIESNRARQIGIWSDHQKGHKGDQRDRHNSGGRELEMS